MQHPTRFHENAQGKVGKLEHLLVHCDVALGPESISFHFDACERIEQQGLKIEWVPAYSPRWCDLTDLNE